MVPSPLCWVAMAKATSARSGRSGSRSQPAWGDHPTVGAGGDQAVAVLVVDVGGPADRAVEVGEAAEEPQRDRPRRQALEEGTDGRRVLDLDRPHVHG
jgi:hypothetical protein